MTPHLFRHTWFRPGEARPSSRSGSARASKSTRMASELWMVGGEHGRPTCDQQASSGKRQAQEAALARGKRPTEP